MKQLPMTPELSARIKAAVGEDVETEKLAVFECIALNTKQLPGKAGSLFEDAKIPVLTLQQMATWLESGRHIPLISDHQLMGEPKGRAFAGELHRADDGTTELRVLFYLDPTEEVLIAKLNSGTLDEVSVSFLSTQFLCSECGWDYFSAEALPENIYERTCANGHTIGKDGVHAELVGLSNFIELSLVARGAADNPKIVGKSQSKLHPTSQQLRLAASGIEIDGLVCRARTGEEPVPNTPDFAQLTADLVSSRVNEATLTASVADLTGKLAAAETSIADLNAKLSDASAKLAEAETKIAEAEKTAGNQEDVDAGIAFLTEVLNKVAVAAGAEAPADAPKTFADLAQAIKTHTSDLTAILPIGGVSTGGNESNVQPKLVASAFSNRNLGSK